MKEWTSITLLKPAFSPFTIMFSTLPKTNLIFSVRFILVEFVIVALSLTQSHIFLSLVMSNFGSGICESSIVFNKAKEL